ncbi:DMT family transporter [Ralstonia solanacearum]|uniref:DMT family transporter n=1 Tax=Ralstonia solanacearum TaxID=305 RepID=UPI001E4F0AFA|nr:DMT family transporter [Ralstonia solanacearum]
MLNKTAMLALVPLGMALAAGAVLPFQATGNATAGRVLGHPLWGALTSLSVSSIVILVTALLLRIPAPTLGAAIHGPWWLWIGGVLGAVYVGSAAAVTPKLGAGGFLVCVVAGQILAAVLVDHFGWMGLMPKPINLARAAGVVLILAGVLMVQGAVTAAPSATDTPKPQAAP